MSTYFWPHIVCLKFDLSWDLLFSSRDHSHVAAHHSRDEGSSGPDSLSPAVRQPGQFHQSGEMFAVIYMKQRWTTESWHFLSPHRPRKTSCWDQSWKKSKSTTRTGSSCGSLLTERLKVKMAYKHSVLLLLPCLVVKYAQCRSVNRKLWSSRSRQSAANSNIIELLLLI